MSKLQQLLLTLFPVILFTVVEEWGGLKWALIFSVVYALFEMGWEFYRFRRVSSMTLFSNLMVVGLSGISFYTEDGFWFKMQPAILEVVMAGILMGSYFLKKPLLVVLMKQNNSSIDSPMVETLMEGMTLRLGFFFLFQASLAVYAALYWSTEIWAFLKSIGIFIMLMIYMAVEMYLFRRRRVV